MDEWKEETLKMITVLMASYNGGRYIRQQLDSILAQDEEDVRILVSDDCSSDGSRELLKEYEASRGDRVLALDWHLEFPAPGEGNWDWMGIRAHRFQLAEGPGDYVFPYEVVGRIEDTFSFILQIRRQGDPEAKPLRWEVEKALHLSIPDRGFVRVPP